MNNIPKTDSDALALFVALVLTVDGVSEKEKIAFSLLLGVYYGSYKEKLGSVSAKNDPDTEMIAVCAAYHMTLEQAKKIFEEVDAANKEKEEKQ